MCFGSGIHHLTPKLMTFTTSRKRADGLCTSAIPAKDQSPKKKNARLSGRLVFVSIFARGRVRRRCSREGTVQLGDAMAFESILKLHHPLYREGAVHSTERRPLSHVTKIDKNSVQIDTDTEHTQGMQSPRAPLRWEPEASRITSRTPPASPRSSSRTTASTGDCTRPPSPRRPPSPPRRQPPAPCEAARRARRLPPGAGSR